MTFIPRSKESIRDLVIGAVLILLGLLAPGTVVDSHISGIAIGLGLGWGIHSLITNKKGNTQ